MPGLIAALALASAGGCIDVRPLFVAVELRGTIVRRASRGGPAAWDLALDRPICVDDGAPSAPLARVGIYATVRPALSRLRAHVGRRVRVRGQAFTSFAIARPRRAIMVVDVEAVDAAAGR